MQDKLNYFKAGRRKHFKVACKDTQHFQTADQGNIVTCWGKSFSFI